MILLKTSITFDGEIVFVWHVLRKNNEDAELGGLYKVLTEDYKLKLYKQNGITYISSKDKDGKCRDADITGVVKMFAELEKYKLEVMDITRDQTSGSMTRPRESVSFQQKKIW